MTKIYAILDTEDNAFVAMKSGKCSWQTEGHAKAAYTHHLGPSWIRKDSIKYVDQTRYQVVELTEPYFRLIGLEK